LPTAFNVTVRKTLLIIIGYAHLLCKRITSLTMTALLSSLCNEALLPF